MTTIKHNEMDDSVLETVVGSISQTAFPTDPVRVFPNNPVYPTGPVYPQNPIFPQNPIYPQDPI